MRRTVLICLVVLASVIWSCGGASAQTSAEYKLGFKVLADQIPQVVGVPLENEYFNLSNGNSEQRTSTGLMVWRKADNWTAFTNGWWTWVNGPFGVQERLNEQRFAWEKDPPVASTLVAAPPPAPAPQPAPPPPAPMAVPAPQPAPPAPTADPAVRPRTSFDAQVKNMDHWSAGPGATVQALMAALNDEWSRMWGWKPSRPTTIYLYSDSYGFADGVSKIAGEPISTEEREFLARNVAGVAIDKDVLTDGYAVVMNLAYRWGSPTWEAEMKTVLVHEYTHVMQQDVAPNAGPVWFLEGMAELMAYVRVQESPFLISRLRCVAEAKNQGWLPSLHQLHNDWGGTVTRTAKSGQAAYGTSYLAVKFLADKVGGMPLRQVLEKVAAGEKFESALQSATGYTVERLDAEYRTTIPQY